MKTVLSLIDMNTVLALLALATAYGFIVTIMWLSEKARHKDTILWLRIKESNLDYQVKQRKIEYDELKSIEADRDQLAQALKEMRPMIQRRGKDGRYIKK